MSKFELKNKVTALRRRGLSIKEISNNLALSKSTVSLWCRDIILTGKQVRRLRQKMLDAGHTGRLKGAESNHKKKIASIELGKVWAKDQFGYLSKREFFIAGIALYWAEGSKSYNNQLSFINSDPEMIIFMHKWFITFFDIDSEDIIARIFINEIHKSRIAKVLNFWSDLLNLTKDCFRKTIFIKSKQRKVYANHDSYFGQLSLRFKKSSTLRYKILALINNLKKADVAQVARASHS